MHICILSAIIIIRTTIYIFNLDLPESESDYESDYEYLYALDTVGLFGNNVPSKRITVTKEHR